MQLINVKLFFFPCSLRFGYFLCSDGTETVFVHMRNTGILLYNMHVSTNTTWWYKSKLFAGIELTGLFRVALPFLAKHTSKLHQMHCWDELLIQGSIIMYRTKFILGIMMTIRTIDIVLVMARFWFAKLSATQTKQSAFKIRQLIKISTSVSYSSRVFLTLWSQKDDYWSRYTYLLLPNAEKNSRWDKVQQKRLHSCSNSVLDQVYQKRGMMKVVNN